MRNFLLLSTMVVIPVTALAASDEVYTNTHTYTPIELTSISQIEKAYKTAAVCFLGTENCGSVGFGKGDEDMNIDTAKQCKNEGFVSACSSGYCLDGSCAYNQAYGKCLAENCPTNSSTTCIGAVAGKNACGVDCKQCCTNSCPAGYDYSESQLTGGTGNGWIKDSTESCDHCSKGKLYKRKAAPVPAGYKTCGCGGTNPFVSAGTTYYSSCNCCSSCSGSPSTAGMAYYNSCYNSCTGQTLYTAKACDNYCAGSQHVQCGSGMHEDSYNDECGNACYYCACSTSRCVTSCKEEGVYAILSIKESSCGGAWYDAGSHSVPRWYGGYCVNVEDGSCIYDGSYWCKC